MRLALILVLITLLHICMYMAFGASAVLCMALLSGIIVLSRDMIWAAAKRNSKELQQFQMVNRGLQEPHPRFLVETWK